MSNAAVLIFNHKLPECFHTKYCGSTIYWSRRVGYKLTKNQFRLPHFFKGSAKFWRESGRSRVLTTMLPCDEDTWIGLCCFGNIFSKRCCFQQNPISLRSTLLGHTFSFLFLLNANAHVKGLIFNMVINLLFTKSGRLVGKLYFSTHVGR